ncbi:MAG TPA: hypothetical protein VLF66_13100, partial [Thermoanaerobaculia bacterium]|nr:hypothetical protein [Thermoanaerobaculia bacterium]
RFFTGRAVLDLRVHDARTGRLLGAGVVEVGTGGGRGELAPSELAALTQAATEAGRRAADEVLERSAATGRTDP